MTDHVISPDGRFYWHQSKEKWVPIELMPKNSSATIRDSVVTGNVTQNITHISNDPATIASAVLDVLNGHIDAKNPGHVRVYEDEHKTSANASDAICFQEERSLGKAAFLLGKVDEGISHYQKAVLGADKFNKSDICSEFAEHLRSESLFELESAALSKGIEHSMMQGDEEGAWWVMLNYVNSKLNVYKITNEPKHLEEYITLSRNYITLSMKLGHEVSAAYSGIGAGLILEELGHPLSREFFADAAENHMAIKYSRRSWHEELKARGFTGEGWNPIR